MIISRRSLILRHVGFLFLLGIFLQIMNSWYSHYWTPRDKDDQSESENSNLTFVIHTAFPGADHPNSVPPPGNETKRVLLWTPLELSPPSLSVWKIQPDTLANCPYKCTFTTNDLDLNTSHAVVFEKTSENVDYTIPSERVNLDQIWAVLRLEPLISLKASNDFTNFYNNINWTITYRKDSDVEWKVGKIIQKTNQSRVESQISGLGLKGKKGLIAWINSDCTTSNHRQLYVNQLKKFIPVHNYGDCKPREGICQSGSNCPEILGKNYKFWLVYETSFCNEFLGREYYNALKYGMVPIVFAHSSFTRIAIPGSYINGTEFKTPEELAKFIKLLDANPEQYLKYFEWRESFQVLTEDEMLKENWCALCTKLHVVDVKAVQKYYTNLSNWFLRSAEGEDECFVPMLTETAKEFFQLFKFD